MQTRTIQLASPTAHVATVAARPSTTFRIHFSVLVLLCGWTLAAVSSPVISETSAWATVADAVGWTCFLFGAMIRLWSICHIAGRKSLVAVDTGPYALCRNPLYIGTFLIIVSEAAFLKSTCFLLAAITLIAFYQLFVVPGEEQKLLVRLGAEFTRYAARVPRWIPRFDPKCLEPAALRDRSAVLAEIRCLLCWLSVPILGLVTCYLRAQSWWPHYVPGF